MNTAYPGLNELHALCEAVIERRLTPEQHGRLEHLVLEYPEARRFYVEYMHQHASLRWSVAEPDFLARLAPDTAPRSAELTDGPAWTAGAARRRLRYAVAFATAAALLVLGIGLGLRSRVTATQPPAPFASLAEVKACKWDGGTLPTEAGTGSARAGSAWLRAWRGSSSTMGPRSRSRLRPTSSSARRSTACSAGVGWWPMFRPPRSGSPSRPRPPS